MGNPFNPTAGLAASDCSSIASIASPVFSVPSRSSSASGTANSEDILQANSHHDIRHSAIARLQDGGATHTDCTDESKFRCSVSGCENKSFRFEKDLKRHTKTKHDPNAELWYCGCCQNLGRPDEGKKRKDKILGHLRQKHGKWKPGEKTFAIDCSVDDCHTLFTATSCLNTHLEKYHPGQSQTSLVQPNGSTCDCSKNAEARTLLDSHRLGANKHSAESGLESAAKRGKHGTGIYQQLEPMPQTVGPNRYYGSQLMMSNPSWFNLMTGNTIWQSFDYDATRVEGTRNFDWSNTGNELLEFPLDFDPNLINAPGIGDFSFLGMNMQDLHNGPAASITHPVIHHLSLDQGGLIDLLMVLITQEFKDLRFDLQAANDGQGGASNSPVAYNPKKESIVLTGFSVEVVERVQEGLQKLLATHSEHYGSNYLKKSQSDEQYKPSRFRGGTSTLSSTSEECNGVSRPEKIFPIKTKDHRRLVALWFNQILPALPKILGPSVGETYTASLVRRGQCNIRAEPCIEIESPTIPGSKAREIIKDLLNDICAKGNQDRIRVRFSQGSARELLGGGEKDGGDDAQEDEDIRRRYQFNMARPYSKHRMGASLGLLCSNKVVGTLGGYVYVDGDKYMLTSEHFVARSQEPENRHPEYRNGDDQDLETLISPSRFDLGWLEKDLKQTLRDLCSVLHQQYLNTYGDRDVPVDSLGDQHTQSPEIAETLRAIYRTQTLHGQVKKSPPEYAIGSVYRRSLEPIHMALPKSLHDAARLDDGQEFAKYHMDWALCKLNSQATGTSENRHKYRSENDARTDDYTEEKEREPKYQSGDLLYQTCSVESGIEVYYVGQGSGFRSGLVNLPSLVSRDSVKTLDWAIISLDGQKLQYSHVEGDSGAWVIKRNGNMLMGQIHSYTSGQVLFTPIDAIFDDISRDCGVEVSLPPLSLDPEPTTEALPLCSIPRTPPQRPLNFLKPQHMLGAKTADKLPFKIPPLKTQTFQTSSKIAGKCCTVTERNEVSSTTLGESSSFLRGPTFTSQVRIRSDDPISLCMYKLSWSTVKDGKVTKFQTGFRRSRLKSSQLRKLAAPLCSAFVNAEPSARTIEDVDHCETLPGFSREQRVGPLPKPEFTSRLIQRPVLESCSVVV